jgi:carbamoyl-phosphate synthase large subunit
MANSSTVTVLVTAAGSAAALNCINALQNQSDLEIRLVAADANAWGAGLYKADSAYTVPKVDEVNYIDAILGICEKENVDVVIPTFSEELPVFALHQTTFESLHLQLLIPSLRTIRTFKNKWQAFQFFRTHQISTPQTWLAHDPPTNIRFPLWLKPLEGSGSRNSYRIDNNTELEVFVQRAQQDCVLQPFIDAPEFTIDLVSDTRSRVLAAVARERIMTRGGLAIVSRTVSLRPFRSVILELVSLGELIGPTNIQGFLLDGSFTVTDVNTRFAAGGLPLTVAAGANIPLITLKLALGLSVPPQEEYREGLTMIRYYTEMFVSQNNGNKFQSAKGH